jgi:hypothetical protein
MRKFLSFFILAIFFAGNTSAQEARVESVTLYQTMKGDVFYNRTFFINDSESPVQIENVSAQHVPEETALAADQIWDQLYKYLSDDEKDHLRNYARSGLSIFVDASGDEAVAVKFGIVAYDAFKEHLGGLTAVTMDPPTYGMEWDFSPAYLFKFKKYGVAGVYVRQVRLKDGTIWNFDEEETLSKFYDELGVKISLDEKS